MKFGDVRLEAISGSVNFLASWTSVYEAFVDVSVKNVPANILLPANRGATKGAEPPALGQRSKTVPHNVLHLLFDRYVS